ncbi:cytochrome c oxidase subunit II [Oceanibacterium hippocampi]|uniref:Cytochrome c oxidase subunit 2 n=1 Tax=Oceanibacterium hippocampi TaxID=745714 RepID=A0A1Y5S5V3_9PROT|nr:cytochrome c oxidase subunit II [Oceanibacterium hippocampi]SLN33233.1 Cytochrome c oxidase subunit 2 precursor [Oceanibacterium hippocampi]
MLVTKKLAALVAPLVAVLLSTALMAIPSLANAAPQPWELNFQPAKSPVMHEVAAFHNLLLVVITLITIFVVGLLIYALIRFNRKANPVPSKTAHNTLIEILWTVLPIMILVIIAVPSFKLLYFADRVENPEMTLKITGYQWYWGYEYPDADGLSFDAIIVADEDLKEGQPRLLTTDNAIVLPVDTTVQILVTSADVLHSWAMPPLGVKLDAVPGRLNETWLKIDEPGMYYGQCSELCGTDHGFMPIMIRAVSKEEFQAWLVKAKEEFAMRDDGRPLRLAAVAAE